MYLLNNSWNARIQTMTLTLIYSQNGQNCAQIRSHKVMKVGTKFLTYRVLKILFPVVWYGYNRIIIEVIDLHFVDLQAFKARYLKKMILVYLSSRVQIKSHHFYAMAGAHIIIHMMPWLFFFIVSDHSLCWVNHNIQKVRICTLSVRFFLQNTRAVNP